MATLRKAVLLSKVEDAIRASGWNLLYLSKNAHPARYRLFKDGTSITTRVYIWNITHGGKGRRADEYRIQITGVNKLTQEANSRTLILGWWDAIGVFTGWDIRQHSGSTSSSPSMQVSEGALRQALLSGFAPYVNQNGETAIAFRPDFLPTYIEFLESLHDSGSVPKEAAILAKISEDAKDVEDKEIEDEVAAKRQYAIVATKRAVRALDFGKRVLGAYDHKCAMCGMQLRLVDGAHILPVADKHSTDQTSNGIALCALHHRAYDRALVGFDPLFKVGVNERLVKELRASHRADGLAKFRSGLRPILVVPPNSRDRPAKRFVEAGNALRGWEK